MPKAERARGSGPPLWVWALLLVGSVAGLAGWLAGCTGWDPTEPFERNAPDVDRAIDLIDGGQHESAAEVLESYLGTGPCGDAGIGLPPTVRKKADGSFDLGLALFYLAEKYGQRFGDEENADGGPAPFDGSGPNGPARDTLDAQRSVEIDCAQIIVKAIANDPNAPADLRARAFYLSGNLEFLRGQYEDAVTQYDRALEIVPGVFPEAGGDGIGRDAAWNRAIALRRIQEQDAGQPDAEPDAQPDAEPDSGDDGGGEDAGEDGGDDGDAGGGQDAGQDAGEDAGDDGGGQDAGEDSGADPQEPPPEGDEEAEPEQDDTSQIDRLLDELEEAPTYQEEDAKQNAAKARRRRVMEDK